MPMANASRNLFTVFLFCTVEAVGGAMTSSTKMKGAKGTIAAKRPQRRSSRRVFPTLLTLIWIGVAGTALVSGFEYYATPLQERPYSELHELYKPTGLIGHGFGVVGTLMIVLGVTTYTLRRRVRAFARLGRLGLWLQFHIFLCTLGPFLIVLHTSFKFGGIVSIALWSMLVVVASGVFGRYVYVRIPKTISGQFLSLKAIQKHKEELIDAIRSGSGLAEGDVQEILALANPRKPKGALSALVLPVRHRFNRRADRRQLEHHLAMKRVSAESRQTLLGLLEEEVTVERQMILLGPFQRMFSYWHSFHFVFAIVMLLIAVAHVYIAILFGYAWVL